MTPPPGSATRPLRVAIVGSGPSGFYAAEALFKVEGLHVRVDMIDRLPTPYGLVRGGVAPDHQNIKSVVKVYQKVAENAGFRFHGNVRVGNDVQVAELEQCFDMIVWAIGCESDQRLGIPGEDLEGVHSATSFVGWYNGHPDHRAHRFDLARAERAVVVGNGNVSMDVSRILLKAPDALASTDIADHALEQLRGSSVREVSLLGRRGPAQAAFSPKEIEEIAELPDVDVVVRTDEAALDEYSTKWLETQARSAQRNVKFLTEHAALGEGSQPKKLRARFCVAPVELLGRNGRVVAVKVQHAVLVPDSTGTPRPQVLDRFEEIPADLVFRAIGYRGVPISGLAHDERKGIVPNESGRVLDRVGGSVRAGHYVVGWAKRGPSGLVGTNSPDSKATVEQMMADLQQGKGVLSPSMELPALLQQRGIDVVSWQDWTKLDAHEVATGAARGKVRDKQPDVAAIMATVRTLRG